MSCYFDDDDVLDEDYKPPKYLVDPARSLTQWCFCGHSQAAHGGALNHGACEMSGCECARFTWTSKKPHLGPPVKPCYLCNEDTQDVRGGVPMCLKCQP